MKSEKATAKPTAKAAAAKSATAAAKPAAATKSATAAVTKETAPASETKAVVKEETPKTTVKKTPAKKTTAKKQEIKETVYLQYLGKEINKEDVLKKVKENWTKVHKKKIGDIKSVTLYLKPEENAAYFVINGDITGSVEL